ncbi:hypothetical protein QFZ94_008881 [Paraburkholderia sp. JPY465]
MNQILTRHLGATEPRLYRTDDRLTTSAIGSFPGTVVSGLAKPASGYSLQLNTNSADNPAYCAQNGFHSDCRVWQQSVYSPDLPNSEPGPQGQVPVGPQIFIQDWILLKNKDDLAKLKMAKPSPCPAGWTESPNEGCYKNSPALAAPDIPVCCCRRNYRSFTHTHLPNAFHRLTRLAMTTPSFSGSVALRRYCKSRA